MSFTAERIPYAETGAFSGIVLDYLSDAGALREFYQYRPDIAGIQKATEERSSFPVNRNLLADTLQEQYKGMAISDALKANLAALRNENCFTVCTAHQPNIFTGHLYFIYKILHAIRLSNELDKALPGKKFVPVYYMGSEDADLAELGEVNIYGTAYHWQTKQTGAVGRMKIDREFMQLIDEIAGRLLVEPFGPAVMQQVRNAYREGITIEAATFQFVHTLFNEYGLVTLLPDNRAWKQAFSAIIEKELDESFSHEAVSSTVAAFPKEYKVQATGREINLFYLEDNARERIEKAPGGFRVAGTDKIFTESVLKKELADRPEKFSPNVILRPVFQEMILPDVAFIGGGGELAYWLELKNVFIGAHAFFPVLVLRNSFALINKSTAADLAKLSFSNRDIFRAEKELLTQAVKKESKVRLQLTAEKEQLLAVYERIAQAAAAADNTLAAHSKALYTQALRRIETLEKKMLKAEKKKFDAHARKIKKMKSMLFPGAVLQERVDNILPYLSRYGKEFIQMLYENSPSPEAAFTVITEA